MNINNINKRNSVNILDNNNNNNMIIKCHSFKSMNIH